MQQAEREAARLQEAPVRLASTFFPSVTARLAVSKFSEELAVVQHTLGRGVSKVSKELAAV